MPPAALPSAIAIPRLPARFQGMALMVFSMVCFAGMNNCVRYVSQILPTEQVVLLRNLVALALLSAWILPRKRQDLRTRRFASHLGRATLGIVSMHTWFYALGHMKLAEATALSFTTPIFTTILAILVFRERSTGLRWLAVGLGLLGAIVILRPNAAGIDPVAGYALVSSVLIAIVSIWVKSLSRTETTASMLFYMALFMTVFSLPFGIAHWHAMSPILWVVALLLATTSLLAHSLLIEAYKHTEMTVLMPFDFTRLIFTAIFAYLWFGESIDGITLLGAGIIVAGSLIGAREGAKSVLAPSATAQPSANVAAAPPDILATREE